MMLSLYSAFYTPILLMQKIGLFHSAYANRIPKLADQNTVSNDDQLIEAMLCQKKAQLYKEKKDTAHEHQAELQKAISTYLRLAKKNVPEAIRSLCILLETTSDIEQTSLAEIAEGLHIVARLVHISTPDNPHSDALYHLGLLYANGKGVEKNGDEALEFLGASAKLGNSRAMLAIAAMYECGELVNKDAKKAIQYYENATYYGNATAMLKLGMKYENGEGIEKNTKKAFELYRKSADRGNPIAMILLANGLGLSEKKDDHRQSIALVQQALDSGKLEEIVTIAAKYETGDGVCQDHIWTRYLYREVALLYTRESEITSEKKRAFELFNKAANLGDACATSELGKAYNDGVVVKPDRKLATQYYRKAADIYFSENTKHDKKIDEEIFRCYRKAAHLGDPISMLKVAAEHISRLSSGIVADNYFDDAKTALASGVQLSEQDRDTATKIYREAAKHYYDRDNDQDWARAVVYYQNAAELKDSVAMFCLGCMYDLGEKVTQDKKKAAEFYQQAVDHRYPMAMVNLGNLYETGEGVDKDVNKALELYRLAVKLGGKSIKLELAPLYSELFEQSALGSRINTDIALKLGHMYQHGVGVKQDEGIALQLFELAEKNGSKDAPVYIGDVYLGHKEYSKALEQFNEGINRDSALAYQRVGWMHQTGFSVDKDAKKALEFFEDAVKKGCIDAYYYVGNLYLLDNKSAEAWQQFRLGVQKDAANAYRGFAHMYRNGIKVQKDEKEALRLLKMAADQDCVEALVDMADIYRQQKQYDLAFKKLVEAANRGSVTAQDQLTDDSSGGLRALLKLDSAKAIGDLIKAKEDDNLKSGSFVKKDNKPVDEDWIDQSARFGNDGEL